MSNANHIVYWNMCFIESVALVAVNLLHEKIFKKIVLLPGSSIPRPGFDVVLKLFSINNENCSAFSLGFTTCTYKFIVSALAKNIFFNRCISNAAGAFLALKALKDSFKNIDPTGSSISEN